MKLRVKTSSGSEYVIQYDDGLVQWSVNGDYSGRCWGMKVLDPEEFSPYAADEEMWEYIYDRPWAHHPEVGKRLYIAGKRSWRISTPVVSVEEVAE